MTRLEQLKQRCISLSKDILRLRDAHSEGEEWTPEEDENFDRCSTDLNVSQADLAREERAHDVEVQLRKTSTAPEGLPLYGMVGSETRGGPEERREDGQTCLKAWALHRAGLELTSAQRNAVERTGFDLSRPELELRANQTTALDPEVIPTGFIAEFEKARASVSPIREHARILSTAQGNDVDYPMVDDTGETAGVVTEADTLTEDAYSPSKITFKAFKYGSQVKVSSELLQDSGFNLETEIAQLLGERVGRGTNNQFTLGDSTSEPQGIAHITTGAAAGVSLSEGGTGDPITFQELLNLIHSVDPSYRVGAKMMCHDSMLAAIRKLVDGNERPLWNPDIEAGAPGTCLGVPIVINQAMVSFVPGGGSGAEDDVSTTVGTHMLYGDFSKFIVRDVGAPRLRVLTERYADADLIGFVLWSRHDSRYLNAGTDPIKALAWTA